MQEEFNSSEEETTRKKGDALEQNVMHIFQLAGFKSRRNVRMMSYEIDVLVEIGDRNIIVECKNYQSSTLTLRNLIHQWSSKNLVIKASKVILVLVGIQIKQGDYELANQFNIELWSEKDLEELFTLGLKPEELKSKLLLKVKFRPQTISEVYRDNIHALIIEAELKGLNLDKEVLMKNLNMWLRTYIRTELQINGCTSEERKNHIRLFEGTKEKVEKSFFNLIKSQKKRSEVEYWFTVLAELKNCALLSEDTRLLYQSYMTDLIGEYEDVKTFFEESSEDEKLRFLIKTRLYQSSKSGNSGYCYFGTIANELNRIRVTSLNEGFYEIAYRGIDYRAANLICWILTSEYHKSIDEELKIDTYVWNTQDIDETAEKVFRLCNEYSNMSSMELRDFSLAV